MFNDIFQVGHFTVGSLIGLVLGAFLGHRLAIRRNNQKAFNEAAIEFKSKFLYALHLIDDGNPDVGVIGSEYYTHDMAQRKFKLYLPKGKLKAFDCTWQKYKNWHDVRCNRSSEDVFYGDNEPDYLAMRDLKGKDLIEALMDFGDVKN